MPARVLVVDDIPVNVKLLTAMLESEYYVVSTAADGFETCRRIKADPAMAHIPVVMIMDLSDVADRVRGFEAGADDFLTKPVYLLALMASVRSQLRQKRD